MTDVLVLAGGVLLAFFGGAAYLGSRHFDTLRQEVLQTAINDIKEANDLSEKWRDGYDKLKESHDAMVAVARKLSTDNDAMTEMLVQIEEIVTAARMVDDMDKVGEALDKILVIVEESSGGAQ